MNLYFDRDFNHRTGRLFQIFPAPGCENLGFYLNGTHAETIPATLMVGDIPCLDLFGKGGQFFPRYTFTSKSTAGQLDLFDSGASYERIDNITDEIHTEYCRLYGSQTTKDDIFYFVYGFLHSPDYRQRYAADLKKMLPRIPKLAETSDFWAFSAAGRTLAELHLNYESVEKYPLQIDGASTGSATEELNLRVEKKMKYGGKRGSDKTVLHYNDDITISGIPLEAQEYMLGSRSALDWIIDRYYVRVDKASGIVNDANMWGIEHGEPDYILNLIQRIVTVSIRTVEIVQSLPPLRIREEQ